MSLLDSLPHKVDIQHLAYTQDSSGSDIEQDLPAYVSDEPAWVQPLSAREITVYQARNMEVTHKVYMLRDPGLRLSDVMLPKDGDDIACPYTGKQFQFMAFVEATAGIGLLWKALVKINLEEP